MGCSSNADAMGSTGKQSDYVDRFHRIGIQIHSKIKEQHEAQGNFGLHPFMRFIWCCFVDAIGDRLEFSGLNPELGYHRNG
jgi:hypothetical protein